MTVENAGKLHSRTLVGRSKSYRKCTLLKQVTWANRRANLTLTAIKADYIGLSFASEAMESMWIRRKKGEMKWEVGKREGEGSRIGCGVCQLVSSSTASIAVSY